ncbi:MAG: cytochrome c peroxidase [Gammaproteobacteria bacterium]|nr:cytochrome c peroxidase [Gammaproteobacteria bacterium]
MQQRIRLTSSSLFLVTVLLISACGSSDSDSANTDDITPASVGKKIFFDEDLSSDSNQSCASCHDPAAGFADPNATSTTPVSEGSASGQFGARNAPTAAYAAFIPDFSAVTSTTADGTQSSFQGGQFIDGRRPNLVEQAKDPFLNPLEMNNASAAEVVAKVQNADYADEFLQLFGADAFTDSVTAYHSIATALAAFESSAEVNPFSSKFDAWQDGEVALTAAEQRGFNLFNNQAKCANCHLSDPDPASGKVLFSDFNYFNVGTPVNTANPAYVADNGFRDGGLGESPLLTDPAQQAAEQGKFRTPTLRNIELTAPYMHNGRYATLRQVILHYDIVVSSAEAGFTPVQNYPEVDTTIAAELNFGDPNLAPALGLSNQQIDDLIAFMLTLTDGYR